MSFNVKVEPGGHAFKCEPSQSILDAALTNGVAFPYGCRGGACGACMGTVKQGDIFYPSSADTVDLVLQGEPANRALFCQARPRSDLIIEIKEIR